MVKINPNKIKKSYNIYTLDLNLHQLENIQGLNMFHRSQSLLEPVTKEIQKQVKLDLLKGHCDKNEHQTETVSYLQNNTLDPEV